MKIFEVKITQGWKETMLDYQTANSHKEIAEKLPIKNNRIYNERFREIEKTGTYYRISDVSKGGKAFIFECIL